MPLFLSSYANKIDKKGRVSVPATFRAAVASQAFQGIVLFRSASQACLEGFDMAAMETLAARLDHFDLFSENQDDLATAIFGDSVELAFDGDGRITLPADLMAHAHLGEQAVFVGMGRKFQVWEPSRLQGRKDSALHNIRSKKLTVPSGNGGAA